MAERGPPGGDPARAIEEVVLPVPEGVDESGPDSGPDVSGDEGRGEACTVVRPFIDPATAITRLIDAV